MARDLDGWWDALDDVTAPEPDDLVVACMMCLVEAHPDVAEPADLPPGRQGSRDRPGDPWRRRERVRAEEA